MHRGSLLLVVWKHIWFLLIIVIPFIWSVVFILRCKNFHRVWLILLVNKKLIIFGASKDWRPLLCIFGGPSILLLWLSSYHLTSVNLYLFLLLQLFLSRHRNSSSTWPSTILSRLTLLPVTTNGPVPSPAWFRSWIRLLSNFWNEPSWWWMFFPLNSLFRAGSYWLEVPICLCFQSLGLRRWSIMASPRRQIYCLGQNILKIIVISFSVWSLLVV